MKILILSDTHGHLDDRIIHYSNKVDEIWHAGDIGSLELIELLKKKKEGKCCLWKHRWNKNKIFV